MIFTPRRSVTLASLACCLATAVITAVAVSPASASDHHHRGSGNYLALGDSVPFGFSPLLPLGSDPSLYVGYPEVAAPRLHLALTNLACPGQASGGFLSLAGADNGCFFFRAHAALHTTYAGAQLQAALDFLTGHPRTKVVTLMLGANDLFLCVNTTADRCSNPQELADTVATLTSNLRTALTAIRAVYHGRLIGVTYYTTNYADPTDTVPIQDIDGALAGAVTAFGGVVADGYVAFQKRAARFGGDACAAGLLIRLTTGGCDVHPSAKGARVLARIVTAAARTRDDDR